jgi:hypothetical protein
MAEEHATALFRAVDDKGAKALAVHEVFPTATLPPASDAALPIGSGEADAPAARASRRAPAETGATIVQQPVADAGAGTQE